MKMNMMIAAAILAWCEAVDAAALPQAPGLLSLAASGNIAIPKPAFPIPYYPGVPNVGVVPTPGLPAFPIPYYPGVPNVGVVPTPGLPAPGLPVPGLPVPGLPVPGLPVPVAPIIPVPSTIPNLTAALPKLPVIDASSVLSSIPKLPGLGDIPTPVDSDSVDSYVKVGKIVLSNVLNLLWKSAQAAKLPGDLSSILTSPIVLNATVPAATIAATPIATLVTSPIAVAGLVAPPAAAVAPIVDALNVPLEKRQLVPVPTAKSSSTPSAAPIAPLGGLTSGLTGGLTGGLTSGLTGGLTSGLTGGLTGSSGPLGAVTSTTNSLPVVGGLTGGLTGGSGPLGAIGGAASTVANTAGSLPVVGGVTGGLTGGSGPLGAVGGVTSTVANTAGGLPVVGGAVAPVTNAVGGLTSGNPLGAVGGVVSGALNTVGNVAGSVPVVGSAVQGAVNTVGSAVNGGLPGPYPTNNGVPGTDPVGGLSISIIATLLSLLKKDPLSLFGGGIGFGGLRKRDLLHLEAALHAEKREVSHPHKKRQALLPSLSGGIPGVGIGSLSGSGVPGVSPDVAFLVGSIAKSIAVPGGKGLGSVTGGILNTLNDVVPNFLWKLPVIQDSVPTFGVIQLLVSINPAKFGVLSDLTSLAALSNAASQIPAADIAFLKTLPLPSDPYNLLTTITTFSDNVLSLAGNVVNFKASVAVLALRNLGLAVAGFA